jgi:hypothetical protein
MQFAGEKILGSEIPELVMDGGWRSFQRCSAI